MQNRIFSWRTLINISVLLICSNCLSPISVETEYFGGQLVVSGQISTIADRSLVQLGRTAKGYERLPEPLSGATVAVSDDLGNVLEFYEDTNKPGNYLLDQPAIPGRTYQLMVRTPTGENYLSQPEKVPTAFAVDEITTQFETEVSTDVEGVINRATYLKIYVTTEVPESEEPVYIKWDTEEVWVLVPTDFPDIFGNIPPSCYITQNADPQRISMLNSNEVRTRQIENKMVVKRLLDQSFHTRHYFTTYNTMLTPGAYEYWRKVNIVANQVGSVFDSPPAEVKGNVFRTTNDDEIVQGYFQAVNQTFKRIYFVADDLPYKLPEYCEFSYQRSYESYPPYCLECIRTPNSSYVAPIWF
ncbi:MAG TPA: DUF4249 domain-containing protein [Chryseosolibacter sp.]